MKRREIHENGSTMFGRFAGNSASDEIAAKGAVIELLMTRT